MSDAKGTTAAPVGPIVPPGDDKDLTMIAPPKAAKAKKAPKGKGAKGKGGKGKSPTIASHPKARAQIRAAKGWGGLAGFGIAAYLSYQAQVPLDQLGLRAIAAGIGGYLVAWAFMLTLWRYLLLAELRVLAERQHDARAAAMAAGAAKSLPVQGQPAAAAPPGGLD
jgi:hypothetical protein